MSLRVLLADESSTIKKVMQLALQDFDVEVKAVPIGLDVLEVSRSFQPEIIFVDVLLSKRNGYEVCHDLKSDLNLNKIPVVLMWSGFMEIDERKLQICKPDRRLEKPFDAEALRKLVRDLVPRLQTNAISAYLNFPNLPDIEEPLPAPKPLEVKIEPVKQPEVVPPTASLSPPPSIPSRRAPEMEPVDFKSPSPSIDAIDELDEIEEFQNVPLPKMPTPQVSANKPSKSAQEDWARQDLAQFKIPLVEDDLSHEYELSKSSISSIHSMSNMGGQLEEISLEEMDLSENPGKKSPAVRQGTGSFQNSPSTPATPPPPQSRPAPVDLAQVPHISHERIEQVLREQVREVLEGIAWKIIPDMAERIVREELAKLMTDAERL